MTKAKKNTVKQATSGLFSTVTKQMEWGGRKLILETGRLAQQADGAVLVKYGETVVLATVVASKKANPDAGFFPLSVHYLEKSFAVGRIPGGYNKREGKPSDYETLTSRIIDRPIRPLFPDNFFNEVQVICTTLSYDFESDTQITAMIAASAALSISGIPFSGPIGAAKVGFINDEYVLNPSNEMIKTSRLDLVVAGTKEGVLMVESEASELTEKEMLEAITFGHNHFQPVIKMIEELKKEVGKPVWVIENDSKEFAPILKVLEKGYKKELVKAYEITNKQERYKAISKITDEAKAETPKGVDEDAYAKFFNRAFDQLQSSILRQDIIKNDMRIGGRKSNEIREIACEIGILPRTHGSALFTRGETQACVVATLGTAQDEQMFDSLDGESRDRFMFHYNFPPYSVGETGRVSSPGRREIGHGRLALKALNPVLPTKAEFPYTVRVVSEILACHGSSSMASVCGGALALMDAGVPIKSPVAGIAMGLIKEGKDYQILSDIIGDEDHLGDMDFKVAGTEKGITALQMDLKIESITPKIMEEALKQAKEGRLHILNEMNKVLPQAREDVSSNAPKMKSVMINKDKIRELIGPGGKTIREICEQTGAKIDIEEDGKVIVSAMSQEALDKALQRVSDIGCEPEIGTVYNAKVVKIMDFGAFVNFTGAKEGLVHISEISATRIEKVSDILKVGDEVKVKLIGVDDRGKVRLSMKALLSEQG